MGGEIGLSAIVRHYKSNERGLLLFLCREIQSHKITHERFQKNKTQIKNPHTLPTKPFSALDPTIVWTSSDPAVLSVDASTGLVTAGLSQGNATITATSVDGSIASAGLVLYVGVITISPANPTVYTSTPVQLTASIYPPSSIISWTSSNNALATVSGSGLVTAVDNG